MYLLRMLTENILRWDSLFLMPQNAAAASVVKAMSSLESCSLKSVVLSMPGSTLLLDNWQVLHGRSSVQASEADRTIERIYLDPGCYG